MTRHPIPLSGSLMLAAALTISSVRAQTIQVVNGNVGIGTNAPGNLIEAKNPSSSSAPGIIVHNDLNDQTTLIAYGSAGTGTIYTLPKARLSELRGDGTAGLLIDTGSSGGKVYFNAGASLIQAPAFTLDTTGNVGIGTTSPSHLLTLHAANATLKVDRAANTAGNYSLVAFSTGNVGKYFIGMNADGTMAGSDVLGIYDVAVSPTSPVMTFTGGNVGIGTAAPSRTLDVNGIVRSSGAGIVEAHGPLPYFECQDTNPGGTLASFQSISGRARIYVNGERISINGSSGNVGIGTTTPGYPLDVVGTVHASSFLASSGNNYADFVFEPGYHLAPLSEVEASIKKQGHLPGVPSAADAQAHGIDIAQFQVTLLQKIEELTLHQIALQKENDALRARVAALEHPSSSIP